MSEADELVEVTQEDRDAAKALWRPFGDQSGYYFNCRDDGLMVQAFARHRQQAITVALEEAARVAENPGFVEARDTEWDTGFNYAKQFIATAIRALRGE